MSTKSSQTPLNATVCLAPRHLSARVCSLERNPVALRPDQLLGVAEALNVSVEEFVGNSASKKRGTGPAGRMRQLFEAASKLPRSKQQKIAAVVEAFIVAQDANR